MKMNMTYARFRKEIYLGVCISVLFVVLMLVSCSSKDDSSNVTTPGVGHTVSVSPNASANDEFIKQKALETGGDVNKLSPDDKQKLDSLTRGNTELVLKNMAKN